MSICSLKDISILLYQQSCASWSGRETGAQRGIDIYKISRLLGHQDIRMTQRYSHHCPDSLRDGVQILEADYNLTTVEGKRDVANF